MSFEIKVSATGYKDELSFTYEKPAVIETKALESVIEKADTLKEADYTADSWEDILTGAFKCKSSTKAEG